MRQAVAVPFEPPPCPKCDSAKRVTMFVTFNGSADRDAPDRRKVTGYRCEPCGHEWAPSVELAPPR